jgi:hypothetical protein
MGSNIRDAFAMQISLVQMTPEWASEILSRNTHNRTVRPAMVKQLAADIKDGRWQLTPQTVSTATDGTLLDGQHRLMAIVESGCTVSMMLATDCPPECFAAIDTGHSRTPGDILKIEGVAHYTNVASIIRIVYCYSNMPGLVWVGQMHGLSKRHILDYYREDAERWQEVTRLVMSYASSPCVQVSAVGAFLYLYSREANNDRHWSREYLRLFCTGEMLSSGHPILTFRNWQAANWKVAHVKKAQTQLACHLKAYKAYRDGMSMKQFRQPLIPPMPSL